MQGTGRMNVQSGLIEYENYSFSANTSIQFDGDDSLLIKDGNDQPIIRFRQHCGDLIYQYPRCNGQWEYKQHKLTSRFLQETSLVNITGSQCVEVDCHNRVTGLNIGVITGRQIEVSDDCYERIHLMKGIYKCTMWATIDFEGCSNESCIEIFPGYRDAESRCRRFREPSHMHQLRLRKSDHDQHEYDKNVMFFLNFSEDQEIQIMAEVTGSARIKTLSVTFELIEAK